MKILVDAQCLQTESSNRGIGRVSKNILTHIVNFYDIFVIYNSNKMIKIDDIFEINTLKRMTLININSPKDYHWMFTNHLNLKLENNLLNLINDIAPDVFCVSVFLNLKQLQKY